MEDLDAILTPDVLFFFRDHMDALPIYEVLAPEILAQGPDVKFKVSKTQITFTGRYGFAFVSFLPARKAALRPPVWLTLTFGLGYAVTSPRIDAVSEAYPGRFTHHMLIGDPSEIDAQVKDWLRQAYQFSASKTRKKGLK